MFLIIIQYLIENIRNNTSQYFCTFLETLHIPLHFYNVEEERHILQVAILIKDPSTFLTQVDVRYVQLYMIRAYTFTIKTSITDLLYDLLYRLNDTVNVLQFVILILDFFNLSTHTYFLGPLLAWLQ